MVGLARLALKTGVNLAEAAGADAVRIEFEVRGNSVGNDLADLRVLSPSGLTITGDINAEVDNTAIRLNDDRHDNEERLADIIDGGNNRGGLDGLVEVSGRDATVVEEALVDLRDARLDRERLGINRKDDRAVHHNDSGISCSSVASIGRSGLRNAKGAGSSDALELGIEGRAVANANAGLGLAGGVEHDRGIDHDRRLAPTTASVLAVATVVDEGALVSGRRGLLLAGRSADFIVNRLHRLVREGVTRRVRDAL